MFLRLVTQRWAYSKQSCFYCLVKDESLLFGTVCLEWSQWISHTLEIKSCWKWSGVRNGEDHIQGMNKIWTPTVHTAYNAIRFNSLAAIHSLFVKLSVNSSVPQCTRLFTYSAEKSFEHTNSVFAPVHISVWVDKRVAFSHWFSFRNTEKIQVNQKSQQNILVMSGAETRT